MFDEARWQLTVAGRPVTIERKPLVLLGELLARAGEVVGKDELLDAAWPDVVVVEASLPTAIAKLRRALGDHHRTDPIVATVARIGYRISVPVTIVAATDEAAVAAEVPRPRTTRHLVALGAVAVIILAAIGLVGWGTSPAVSSPRSQLSLHKEGVNAVRRLDLTAVERLIGEGWNPAQPIDREDNDALKLLLGRCEWEPGHDRKRVLLMARTLIDGGARIAHRNVWGDTAYSIAAAPRYCGAAHPATQLIRSLCYDGTRPPGTACEADYRQRRPLLSPVAVLGYAP